MAHHGEEKLDALYPLPWQRVEAFRRVLRATARPHKPEIPPDRYGAGILDVLELIKAELPDPDELISASPENMHRKALTGRSEKIEYITGKEILYLIACAKMKEVDKPGDALFHYVYRNASDEARHLLDNRIGQDFLLDEPNPRSEALKRYGKELLNSLS
jgi:hypothetical protein